MLEQAVGWLVQHTLGSSRIASTIEFFIYDSIKILLLLFAMITAIGFVRTYLSPARIKKALSHKRKGAGHLLASLLGSITPFCSCSSIPMFLSFLRAGVPLGITLSFLITSPIVNEYLAAIMLATFGWKITLIYIGAGILIGTTAGMILGGLGLERHLEEDLKTTTVKEERFGHLKERIAYGLKEARDITRKLWYWILVGVAIGAAIHNYVPQGSIQAITARAGILGVPLAAILGVPMYGSSAGIVPVATALFEKGMPLGTALAFMMAITALSFPEAVILRRAMKLRLIAIFFGTVTIGIIITGYLINALPLAG